MSAMLQNLLKDRGTHPGTAACTLAEVFAETATDAAAVAFALARIPKSSAPILWVQDRLSRKETGRPYLAGLWQTRPIIMVDLSRAVDVLWAMEDGLRCASLAAVLGEVWGDPPALDFTASKRLAMRAEAAEVPCWLIRRAASANLSAARERWRVASLPAARHPHDAHAPGQPRWSLELFRARGGKPGQWVGRYDRTTDRLHFAAPLRDGAVAKSEGTAGQRAAG